MYALDRPLGQESGHQGEVADVSGGVNVEIYF